MLLPLPILVNGYCFLMQLTALLTPALAMLAGEKPAKSVWLGCLVAMGGAVLLTLDKASLAAPPANAAHIAVGETPPGVAQ